MELSIPRQLDFGAAADGRCQGHCQVGAAVDLLGPDTHSSESSFTKKKNPIVSITVQLMNDDPSYLIGADIQAGRF